MKRPTLLAIVCGFLALLSRSPAAKSDRPPAGFIPASDGVQLYYQVDGEGGDPIVVLHGGPGLSMAYLEPDLAFLAGSRRRLIFYDQRGSGRSTVTADPMLINVGRHVEDLEMVRRFFDLGRMILVGHSWGAGLAVHYAARYPEHVARLLLVSPIPPRSSPYMIEFGRNLRKWMNEELRADLDAAAAAREGAEDPLAACRAYWAIFIRGYLADPDHPPPLGGDVCGDPAEAVRNQETVLSLTMSPLGDYDWRPLARSIKARTLVIHGERDPIPMQAAVEWTVAFDRARLLAVPDSGHFPFAEQPSRFFDAADRFLRGHWPDGSEPGRRLGHRGAP